MLSKVWKTIAIDDQKTNYSTNTTNISSSLLPNQISSKILDLEIQLSRESYNPQLVPQLLAAYTAAVQFYEQLGDQKYKLYQKRMKSFLQKPDVYSAINGKANLIPVKRQEANHEQQIYIAKHKTKQEADRLIAKTNQKVNKQKAKIDLSIEQQQTILKERMQRRRINSFKNEISSQNQEKIQIISLGGVYSGIQQRKKRRDFI